MQAKTDAHSPPSILAILSFSRHERCTNLYYSCLISNVWTFRYCRAAAHALRAGSGCAGVLLLSCCLALCPLAPRQAFRFFGRFVVSLSKYRLSSKLSNYRNSFSTIVSYIVSLSNDNNTETTVDTLSNTINSEKHRYVQIRLVERKKSKTRD